MDIDDGSIVKWEVSSLNPAELTVTKAGQSQTVTLSGNSALAEPVVIEDTAPAYIIAHGPLAYWDYYLTNYDDDGNLRVEPAKTTFSLSDDVVSDVPAFYSPDAELCEGDRFGEVVGEAVIMFNYNTDAEKAWFDAIPDNQAQTVQLMSYDGNKTTFNDTRLFKRPWARSDFPGIMEAGMEVPPMTRTEAIKEFFKKAVLPIAIAGLLYCIFKSACIRNGELDLLWLWILCGLPFGIHRMCVWIVPGGGSLGGGAVLFVLNFVIGGIIGGFVLVWRLLVAAWYVPLTIYRLIVGY